MSTYSDYEQRLLDQQSGAELDRIAERRARAGKYTPSNAERQESERQGDLIDLFRREI